MLDTANAVLALIEARNEALCSLWADALNEAGGVYTAMGLEGRLALARGTTTLVGVLLKGGVLSDEQATRFVSPPPYRDQSTAEFVRAALQVSSRVGVYLMAEAATPEVGREANHRFQTVLSSAVATVLRLREQIHGASHLVPAIGAIFSRARSPRVGFQQSMERLAHDLGLTLCVVLAPEGEEFLVYAASGGHRNTELVPDLSVDREQLGVILGANTEPEIRELKLDDPGLSGRLGRLGFHHLVIVPLTMTSRRVGLLLLACAVGQRTPALDPLRAVAPLLAAELAQARQAGALQQAEAALSDVYDAAPTMMCALDRMGRIVRSSRRFRDELGLPDDCIGMPLTWLIHPAWLERYTVLWRLIAAQSKVDQERVDLITANGDRLPIALEAHWLPDDIGRQGICMVVMWDVSTHVEHDRVQCERIDELTAFAYQIAHDLKGPLRTVGGYIGLVEDELASQPPDSALHDYCGRISGAAERGEAMIDGILRFARSTRDSVATPVQLSELIDNVRRELSMELTARQAVIEILADDAPLLGDPAALSTILTNLVSNALRYSDGDAPVLQVGVIGTGAGWATLRVRDEGIGISPEDQLRIFDLFQRAATDRPGTGVGLAVVRRIARLHGGDVTVTSAPGAGSTFDVRLPTA